MSSKIPAYQQMFSFQRVPRHDFIEKLVAYRFKEMDWYGTPSYRTEKDETYERLGQLAARNGISNLSVAGLAGPRAIENIFAMVVGAWENNKKLSCSNYSVFELEKNANILRKLYRKGPTPCPVIVQSTDILKGLQNLQQKNRYNVVDFDFIGGLGGQANAGKIEAICAALENCLSLKDPCVVHVNGSMRRGNSEHSYRTDYFPKLQNGLSKSFTLLESEIKSYMGGQPMIGYQVALQR